MGRMSDYAIEQSNDQQEKSLEDFLWWFWLNEEFKGDDNGICKGTTQTGEAATGAVRSSGIWQDVGSLDDCAWFGRKDCGN